MEIKDLLDDLKLNAYEKSAYMKLLELDTSTAIQLCKQAKVPYGRIYNVLISLEQIGLISILPTEPKKFKIIDPKIAFKLILDRKKEEINKKLKEIKRITKPKTQRIIPHEKDLIILDGADKFYEMLKYFQRTVKKEYLTVAHEFAGPRESIQILRKRAMNRGVEQKAIVTNIRENKPIIRQNLKLGVKIRSYPLEGFRLMIKDRTESVQSIVDPKTQERISIYTRNKAYTQSMAIFFDSLWKKAKIIKP